uniref:Coiled-coil domain containing 15 n=1 Tax=Piliocolobus tephrosceles TaxID=591936 RepID=A0A8C9LIM2_9PRIM
MLGSMAPKKPRNTTRLPLALNPLKSKDVLAVLAERNQAIVPVGAWVEPASPGSSEIPAYTSAYLIEEELKEQLRRKQEALKHFQKQVKYRVNQQIRLRKKQQLQKSYERAEKEGSIAMRSSAAHLTSKRTSVFPNNLNVAIGSSRLPPSLMPGDGIEDEENQNELFQQQAQAELDDEEPDYEESSSLVTDEKAKEDLFGRDQQDQQDILSEDKNKPFSRVQKADLKQPISILIDRRGREALPLDVHQDLLCMHHQASIRGKKVHFKEPYSHMTDEKGREDFSLADYQCLPPKSQDQDGIRNQQPASFMREERVREELPLDYHQYVVPKIQDQDSPREQNKHIKLPSSFEKWEIARGNITGVPLHRSYEQASHDTTDERWRKELLPECHGYILHEIRDPGSAREQAYDGYQSGLSTEFQAPLAFQSGIDKEEDKKERQKQYLRHRRLFMDIEREQVKEQKRQKEQKKKIEKIKKKREQERYAEEQRILRMNFHEDPYSGEKMSEILAQLQLEEIKGAREKQQQREKEYLRYVEALRAQIQEKMQLYNITLPPLCCCGPDFWDAHPDTCANNCIFYKNHRAYTRALHSFINSCDVPGEKVNKCLLNIFYVK